MCVLTSQQLLRDTFLILRGTDVDMIKMNIGLHVKYRLFVRILMKLEFSRQNLEKIIK